MTMTLLPYTIVDVFTDTPLQGNALAVFPEVTGLETETMQRIARELNLSETVFVAPPEGDSDADLRIFTPATELPFAGHPLLGTGFVLGERLGKDALLLATRGGHVPIRLTSERGTIVFGEMEQPLPTREDFARADELLAALGVERSELPVEAYCNGPVHVYVALASEQAVAELHPDLGALEAFDGSFGVNCFAGTGASYKTRMFGPALGVPEDPATGSAAGPLAIHLARHGRIGYGEEIAIRQGEEIGRPSLLWARVDGTREHIDRVVVGGSAVIVARGEYRVH
jgi:trans-2,3-dihydro-3-hydroxyanthranilate isomerase